MRIVIHSDVYSERRIKILEKHIGGRAASSIGQDENQAEPDMELTFEINKKKLPEIKKSLPRWAKLIE